MTRRRRRVGDGGSVVVVATDDWSRSIYAGCSVTFFSSSPVETVSSGMNIERPKECVHGNGSPEAGVWSWPTNFSMGLYRGLQLSAHKRLYNRIYICIPIPGSQFSCMCITGPISI